jgi:hypothetical protein
MPAIFMAPGAACRIAGCWSVQEGAMKARVLAVVVAGLLGVGLRRPPDFQLPA